jgi:hypothetical protein
MGKECLGRKAIAMSCNVRINVIVEGPTEEIFVRNMLREPLALCGIYVNARSVEVNRKTIKGSKFRKPGKQFKIRRGGLLDFEKARSDINRWLSEDESAYLTTMFDLYALPDNFPGLDEAKRQRDPYKKVELLEERLNIDIDNQRFIPYIQLHEFEGLLFSDIYAIDEVLKPFNGTNLTALEKICQEFDNPEGINEGEETAPSKRLLNLYKSYQKPTDGLRIAQRIGLETIRRKCSHFNKWLVNLEALVIYR